MGSWEERSETDELDVAMLLVPYRLSASGRNKYHHHHHEGLSVVSAVDVVEWVAVVVLAFSD
jgi:hypothetical protein